MTLRSAIRSSPLIFWLTGVLAIVSLGAAVALHVAPRATALQTLNISVPAGTQAQMDAGEEIVLFPRRLEVGVGDRIVIENDDTSSHQVGPYVVGPGQRIVQTFSTTGIIEGICTLHPSGEVTIVVR
jgi:plastocyanin